MLGRILLSVLVVLVAAALAILAWPQLLGLQLTAGVAQIVALRGAAAAIALIVAVLFTLVALLWRFARPLFASIAILALAFSATNVVILANRGLLGNGLPEPAPEAVTVLAWNTLGETPPAEEVADLIEDTGANAVSLPETAYDRGAEIVALLASRGIAMQQFTFAYDTIAKSNSTTLLVGAELGEYEADTSVPTTRNRPSVVATPVDGNGPTIAAVHTTAPGMRNPVDWRNDIGWVAALCAEPDLIVAGDLNSTVDHWTGFADARVPGAALGGCSDAAITAGSGAIGTWPTAVPPLLGAPIDHVLVGAAWSVDGFRVVGSEDGSGSDHRPVVAIVSRAAE